MCTCDKVPISRADSLLCVMSVLLVLLGGGESEQVRVHVTKCLSLGQTAFCVSCLYYWGKE